MKHYRMWTFYAVLMSLLIACSDSNNHQRNESLIDTPVEPVATDLDATGIYSGTVETPEGDVGLMTLVLARTGVTAITLETDDSEQATIVLWGESGGDDRVLRFEGIDTDTGENINLDSAVEDGQISGDLTLGAITGEFSLMLTRYSGRASSLAAIAGTYVRIDNVGGSTTLEVSADGAAQLSGRCEAVGSVMVVDEGVNIYQLALQSSCIEVDALVSLQDGEVSGDIFYMVGSAGEHRIALALYRI